MQTSKHTPVAINTLSTNCPAWWGLIAQLIIFANVLILLNKYSFLKYFCSYVFFFLFFLNFYFIFKLYKIVLVLPNIKMNPPQVYMCSIEALILHPFCWFQCNILISFLKPRLFNSVSSFLSMVLSLSFLSHLFPWSHPRSCHCQ